MLKARHQFIIYPFFRWYAVWKTSRSFNPVRIIGEISRSELPVLLISNHISWWDGFWAMYVNLFRFGRKFHFMMLEDQLRKYWFFNHSGGFSVKKGSRSIVESLKYAGDLLKDPANLVLIFPEGKIKSMHDRSFPFGKGIEYILKHQSNAIQIVFMACFIDYLSNEKPGLTIYLKDHSGIGFGTGDLQEGYTTFYRNCVSLQIKEI
jgi:1-acyl-sn-glycerol-3-phosphate acyltransferase